MNNDHGIIWKDENAYLRVASIDPNVTYGSDHYSRILKDQVFHLVKSDPHFVLRTIFAKVGVCLMYLLVFGNIGLLLSRFYRKGLLVDLPFAVGMAFNAAFGIIVMPSLDYLLGLVAFSTIYGLVSIDFAVNSGLLQTINSKLHFLTDPKNC